MNDNHYPHAPGNTAPHASGQFPPQTPPQSPSDFRQMPQNYPQDPGMQFPQSPVTPVPPQTPPVSFVPAKCTSCGAELAVDPTQECVVCQYCGTPFIVSKAVQNYNYQHNVYQTNIVDRRKGAVESLLDYASERQDRKQQRLDEERRHEEEMLRLEQERLRMEEEKKKKRSHLILWILGWIFLFPVPVMILLHRNKRMGFITKAVITVIAWSLYMAMFHPKGTYDTSEPSSRTTEYQPAVVITTSAPVLTSPPAKTEAVTEAPPEEVPETEPVTEGSPETEEAPPEDAAPSDSEIRESVKNGDYSLVTPEFKQTMDEYEAFYDEYIAFMNNYSSGEGDMMSMLNDYSNMMNRLEQWSYKMDAIDEDSLTPADDAYYLLVTLRIEQKLLSAY